MLKPTLTAAIIAKNSASTIATTLESVGFADRILVIDDHSTDNTAEIAKKHNARVVVAHHDSFAEKRNQTLINLTTDWILYVDADEEMTPALAKEIQTVTAKASPGAYRVNRKNYFLGKKMYPDSIDRLFHRHILKGWQGQVHESPIIDGEVRQLKNFLIHRTHTDITSMLAKTNQWSELEANLRLDANHPPVAWWRLIRIALTIFWQQFFIKRLLQYGRPGLFEGYFQIVDKLIVYTKLWEKQRVKNS